MQYAVDEHMPIRDVKIDYLKLAADKADTGYYGETNGYGTVYRQGMVSGR